MDEKIDTAKLIEQIRLKPAIWDVSSKCYSDNQKRRRSWKELAVMFAGEGASPEKIITIGNVIHKKWKKIRDQYSKELQDRNKVKSGDGPKKKIRYIYARQLSFLNNAILMNTSSSSDAARTERNRGDTFLEKEVETEPNSSTPSTSQCKRKLGKKDKTLVTVKRKRSNPFDNKLIDALENISQHRQKEVAVDNDDDRHFLLSLTPTMKIIPTHLKLQVRMEIMQVINNAIFKNSDDEQVNHQNCSEKIYQTSPFVCPTIQTFFAGEHLSSADSLHGHISCYSGDVAFK